MIRFTHHLEIITPCFNGGAEPAKHAEIRPSSIRGQLRWWFRVLGGFKSLAHIDVGRQERLIFGSMAGNEGKAGNLVVRIKAEGLRSNAKDSDQIGHRPFTDAAYLTFPMQSRREQKGHRGVIESGSFELLILWRGGPDLRDDIQALLRVFVNLGSLGFRSRRAMGALAPKNTELLPLHGWEKYFNHPNAIQVYKLEADSAKDAISKLGGWLRSCRSHGRSGSNDEERRSPFFRYAKRDHDIGYNLPGTQNLPAYRPALGLPIIQRVQGQTNNWEGGPGTKNAPKGRFASPVILRPHKDASGKWHALVIFIDARKWPEDPTRKAYLNGDKRAVSCNLYEAMKEDPRLERYP